MNFKILIVAPTVDGISWAEEVQLLASKFDRPDILTGHVDNNRITMHVADQDYDIIHFLGHCSKHGAQLSAGTWSLKGMLATAKSTKAQLFFINGCESSKPGSYLKSNGVAATIAWNDDPFDEYALSFQSGYYEKLFETGDYHESFVFMDPRDGSVNFFANGNYTHIGIQVVRAEIAELSDRVVRRDRVLWLGGVAMLMMAAALTWIAYILQALSGTN